jgi:MFS family permease
VTDAVSRYRGVRAAAALAFGGLAVLAGLDVLGLVVADRWRGDHTFVDVVFWALVALGAVLVVGMVRALVQIVRQPVVLRMDRDGYRVGRQSGATGVRHAPWRDVERVRREQRAGREYVVVQLRSAGSTQIPVRAIAAPPDAWLADLDDRLNQAHGQRRLT